LFRWVAALTGSKNAVKGLGFLLGAALLATMGFTVAVLGMAAVLAVILAVILVTMPPGLPTGRKSAKFSEVFSKSPNVNWLSAARVALFGARDVWFVVGIPIYFYAVLSDGSEAGNRAAFFMIGTFMAVWIILYGAVQAAAPRLLKAASRPEAELIASARLWAAALAVVPTLLAIAVGLSARPTPALTAILVAGLLVFGGLFAVNSSLHSYLILAFTKAERVTMDVGFYYMANAAGRLIGTVLSGLTYQIGGLADDARDGGDHAGLFGVGGGPSARGAPGTTGAVGPTIIGGGVSHAAGESPFTAMWVSEPDAVAELTLCHPMNPSRARTIFSLRNRPLLGTCRGVTCCYKTVQEASRSADRQRVEDASRPGQKPMEKSCPI
jgi:hypothetical protein